jgi:hypothetical protein
MKAECPGSARAFAGRIWPKQILNINAKQTTGQSVGLPVTTGEEVQAAFYRILDHNRPGFSYRPRSEGEDGLVRRWIFGREGVRPWLTRTAWQAALPRRGRPGQCLDASRGRAAALPVILRPGRPPSRYAA